MGGAGAVFASLVFRDFTSSAAGIRRHAGKIWAEVVPDALAHWHNCGSR
jgi:hypothetical protein